MRYRTPPVVVTGDLSADGRPDELDAVAAELARFDDIPRVVITGHRDLAQRRATGRGAQPPVDSDLDYFLALEPALTLGFDDPPRGDPDDRDGPAEDPERLGRSGIPRRLILAASQA